MAALGPAARQPRPAAAANHEAAEREILAVVLVDEALGAARETTLNFLEVSKLISAG